MPKPVTAKRPARLSLRQRVAALVAGQPSAARSRLNRLLAVGLVLALLLCVSSLAQACPQCKKALASANGGVNGNIVRGYFWSILFMLSMPFVLLGSVSSYFYVLVRKARKSPDAAAGQERFARQARNLRLSAASREPG